VWLRGFVRKRLNRKQGDSVIVAGDAESPSGLEKALRLLLKGWRR